MTEDSAEPRSSDGWEPLDDERSPGKARFMVSLGKQQLTDLRDHAERNGGSVAELVRRAVDEFLAAHLS